jgi:hypothetical protein
MPMSAKEALSQLDVKLTSAITDIPIVSDFNTDYVLPDVPSTFIFVDSYIWDSTIADFGGGLFKNRYRCRGNYDVYCLIPKGSGRDVAMDYAQQVRSAFTSFRVDDLLVDSVMITPGGDGSTLKIVGITSEIDNYYFAVAEVSFRYDEIG